MHGLQVIERSGSVGQLSHALVKGALAAPYPAEIEAQHREAKITEGIMERIGHGVVHRAAELRVRMHDQRDRRILFGLRMIAAFEPPLGSGKVYLGHSIILEIRVRLA